MLSCQSIYCFSDALLYLFNLQFIVAFCCEYHRTLMHFFTPFKREVECIQWITSMRYAEYSFESSCHFVLDCCHYLKTFFSHY